jgi:predicted transglutaminase-like cysteine proteinase
LIAKLSGIHASVKGGFGYRTDLEQYNDVEHWVIPDDVENVTGDCEDFALACRKVCRREGIPSRLVYCLTETGEAHLVLECAGYILDNRYDCIKTNTSLDYQWLKISGYKAGEDWRNLLMRQAQ